MELVPSRSACTACHSRCRPGAHRRRQRDRLKLSRTRAKRDRHEDAAHPAAAIFPTLTLAVGLVAWVASEALAAAPASAHGVAEGPKDWKPRRHFRGMKEPRQAPSYEMCIIQPHPALLCIAPVLGRAGALKTTDQAHMWPQSSRPHTCIQSEHLTNVPTMMAAVTMPM
jgi:hypothetical protein